MIFRGLGKMRWLDAPGQSLPLKRDRLLNLLNVRSAASEHTEQKYAISGYALQVLSRFTPSEWLMAPWQHFPLLSGAHGERRTARNRNIIGLLVCLSGRRPCLLLKVRSSLWKTTNKRNSGTSKDLFHLMRIELIKSSQISYFC